MNTIVAIQICCSPLASKLQNIEISSFVKELLLLFITTPQDKMQINPTNYYIYGSKKKTNPPPPPIVLMTTPKNG
jgi:hypothetical protein